MHYEINVSRRGFHLFATASRSIMTLSTLRDVYAEISPRFPEREGFKVTVSRVECTGQPIDPATLA